MSSPGAVIEPPLFFKLATNRLSAQHQVCENDKQKEVVFCFRPVPPLDAFGPQRPPRRRYTPPSKGLADKTRCDRFRSARHVVEDQNRIDRWLGEACIWGHLNPNQVGRAREAICHRVKDQLTKTIKKRSAPAALNLARFNHPK